MDDILNKLKKIGEEIIDFSLENLDIVIGGFCAGWLIGDLIDEEIEKKKASRQDNYTPRHGYRVPTTAEEIQTGLKLFNSGLVEKAVQTWYNHKTEPEAQVYLGLCYCYGWGVTQDTRMAFTYMVEAAKGGNRAAQGVIDYCNKTYNHYANNDMWSLLDAAIKNNGLLS